MPELVPIVHQNTFEPTNTELKYEEEQPQTIKIKVKRKKPAEPKKTSVNQHLEDFKNNGIGILEALNEAELVKMIDTASEQYYNENPLLTDNEFDIVKEYTDKKYPKNTALEKIGADVKGKKVTLPYFMGSMDKIKPDTNALSSWMQKYSGPYVLSCKLDGVSGLYTTENGEQKLYTRGNGKVGQEITHLIRTLNMPNPDEEEIVVRGEFIVKKQVFIEKYKSTFANPRNMVSGIINKKTVDTKATDLHFVAYELIKPELKPSDQMKKMEELGFEVVQNKTETTLSNKMLSDTLVSWRDNYEYEIDGVIVADDNIYTRKDGNPDHAFAFKMVLTDQVAEAKVVDVIWSPSKAGYLKPRVRIEPIHLGGVKIEYATGFNGNFIEANKIGVGALIQIIRSGDVIPYIKTVTVPAETAKMPDVSYHWTESHVDIVLDNVFEDETVREKNITDFFTTLGVDGLSRGNVKRIMKTGNNSVAKILKMTEEDMTKVDGFKEKMVKKIYEGIKTKVEGATLVDVMVASNMMGRGMGVKKLTPIMKEYPDVLTSSDNATIKEGKLQKIQGIGKENARSFVENIPRFMGFLKETGLESKLGSQSNENKNEMVEEKKKTVDTSHPLYDKHIVMTKVRDKAIISNLERIGAHLDNTMGKKTHILITKSHEDVSNKTKYANTNNIPIMTPDEFTAKYFAN